jgi:hypothetical protein
MDDRSNHDREVYDAIEVCRPGSDDISDPSLAFLAAELAANPELDKRYEQLQRLDRRIAKAFSNVPVPVGLADRILAFLALSQIEEPIRIAEAEAALAGPAASEETRATRRRRSRRWLLVTGGALAAAAAILVMVLVGSPSARPMTRETVIQAATDQFTHALETSVQGQLISATGPPNAYPYSRDLVNLPNIRWRWISNFLGRSGVAYDLIGPGRTRATLYVVQGAGAGLPGVPAKPVSSAATGRQLSVAAWQTGGLLYVLVVNGGPSQFPQFLDTAHGPVT